MKKYIISKYLALLIVFFYKTCKTFHLCIQIFVVGVGFGCLSSADSTQSNKMRYKRGKKYISHSYSLSFSWQKMKKHCKKVIF